MCGRCRTLLLSTGTRTVASVAVVVEAKDAKAVAFYKRYGFIDMPDHEDRLFIPMATVKDLFDK